MWGQWIQEQGLTSGYFFQHCVWVDPCNVVLSKAPRSVSGHDQAKYGKGPRWMSPDARMSSRNLRASPYGSGQAHHGDKRVWWFIVPARGKVHFQLMEDGWSQSGEGMAAFVDRLAGILKKMLGRDARLPRVVMSDRGPGFFNATTGHIVAEYHRALTENGFRAFMGDDASPQPADIADVLLHETVAGWVKSYLHKVHFNRNDGPDKCQERFEQTMKECAKYINKEYDVEGLCRSFPDRIKKLVAGGGERLKH